MYPDYTEMNPLMRKYLLSKMASYEEELLYINDLEGLDAYSRRVLPEVPLTFNNIYGDKDILLSTMASYLIGDSSVDIPSNIPLTFLEDHDMTIRERLFGKLEGTMDIEVYVGPNVYIHNVDTELARGLVLSLRYSKIKVKVLGITLTEEMFDSEFLMTLSFNKYSLGLHGETFYSEEPTFAQGVKTGLRWTRGDVSTFQSSIRST